MKIPVYLLTAAFLWSTVGKAGFLSNPGEGDGHRAQNSTSTTTFPAGSAGLFSVYLPGESGAGLSENLSESNFAKKVHDSVHGSPSAKSTLRQQLAGYFGISKVVAYNPTIRKLLYPFHSFL